MQPTLQLRLHPSKGELGAWRGVVHASPRRWWNLFFNPAGTQSLAAQSLIERWYAELVEMGSDAPASRESLGLVMALSKSAFAEGALTERANIEADASEGDGWQLRLVLVDDESGTTEVVYESESITRVRSPTAP